MEEIFQCKNYLIDFFFFFTMLRNININNRELAKNLKTTLLSCNLILNKYYTTFSWNILLDKSYFLKILTKHFAKQIAKSFLKSDIFLNCKLLKYCIILVEKKKENISHLHAKLTSLKICYPIIKHKKMVTALMI